MKGYNKIKSMSTQKLTQEELQQIQALRQRSVQIVEELGQISLIEISLKERKANAERFLQESRNMEVELSKAIQEKYGVGNINLETGEFTSLEAPKTEETVEELPQAPSLN